MSKSYRTGRKTERQAARKPRQARLPGTEDAAIADLEVLAEDYEEIRDERIALNKKEKPLKDAILTMMHKLGKTHYNRAGYILDVVVEKEKVRVRTPKAKKKKEADSDEGDI